MTATPRPASTVVVLRPAQGQFDVLLVRRHDHVAFMGGAHVFPGGRVDAEDVAGTMEGRHRLAAVRELREETGIDLSADVLVPFAHWVTPEIENKRFDTWFYLATVAAGQEAVHDGIENSGTAWMQPGEAIAACARGEIALPPPTWMTLRGLAEFTRIDDVLAWARGVRVERIQPAVEERDGVQRLTVPGQPPTRFVMERGRWVVSDA